MDAIGQAIIKAVGELAILRYFPADPVAREGIMRLLERMVSTPEQLRWLVDMMVDQVGEWQGPRELRGVFCTRYQPADGLEADCSSGQFSPGALEAFSARAHNAAQIASGERLRIEGQVDEPGPVSTDPALNAAISGLSKARRFPPLRGLRRDADFVRVEKLLEDLGA